MSLETYRCKLGKEVPFVPGIVMLGTGDQVQINENGVIVRATDKQLLGQKYCEPLFCLHSEDCRRL